jgi:hypothetical protein
MPDYRMHHPERNARAIGQNQLDNATLVRERWITLGRWIINNL